MASSDPWHLQYSYLGICPAVLPSRRAGPGAGPPAPPGRSQRPRAS